MDNIEKKWYQNKYIWLQIAMLIAFCVITLFKLNQFDMPASTTDELGYLSFPAQMIGLDWKDLMQYTDFYGQGYGILLIPIYALFYKSPWIIYKLIIVFNLLMLIIGFYIILYCAKKLFPQWNEVIKTIFCFALLLYPTNLFYSHLALPEVLLYLLFWFSILCLIKYAERQKFRWLVIFIIILGYMLLTHLRTIGILMAGIITVLFVIFQNKKRATLKHLIVAIGLFVGILAVWKMFQYLHYEYIGGANDLNQANVSIASASSIFTIIIECIKNLGTYIMAIVGRIYYLMTTGNIIFLLGMVYIIKEGYGVIRSIIKKEQLQKYSSVYIFLIIAFIITLLEAATGGVKVRRIDTEVYGRYIENIVGPVLLFGSYALTVWVKSLKKFTVYYILGILVSSPIVYIMMNRAEEKFFISDSAVGLGAFFSRDMQGKSCGISLAYAFIAASVIAIIILVVYSLNIKNLLKMIVLASIIGIYWFGLEKGCEKSFFELRQGIQNKYIDTVLPVLDSDKKADIIYVRGEDPYCVAAKYVQFLVSDRRIEVVNKKDLNKYQIKDSDFIMAYNYDDIADKLPDGYKMECETNDLCVFQK